MTASKPLPEEDVPVLLRHSRCLRPFEMLVSTYGVPHYREFEPTAFVAISYLLMFGMMFGDVGHGLVLCLGGLSAWFLNRGRKMRDFGVLLAFGGLASIVFGFVYGSCFGLESFHQYALWHDPLEGNPIHLIQLTIGFGVMMISLGIALNIINRFRSGDILGGFLDRFGVVGGLFYWGALMLATKLSVMQAHGLTNLAIVLFLALPLVGWTLKGPLEYARHRHEGKATEPGENLLTAAVESLVSAFEAVLSYLANTVSFVRLAAYAMSHAALLAAAFAMAATVRNLEIGGFLSVLIIVLGNALAIVLEGIIASVQALRLEYYEFFGKFFSGTGNAFVPFRLTDDESFLAGRTGTTIQGDI
jgi:V/A-type H+-transporting ATPase subunit I